jgi:hypothetical protein
LVKMTGKDIANEKSRLMGATLEHRT